MVVFFRVAFRVMGFALKSLVVDLGIMVSTSPVFRAMPEDMNFLVCVSQCNQMSDLQSTHQIPSVPNIYLLVCDFFGWTHRLRVRISVLTKSKRQFLLLPSGG